MPGCSATESEPQFRHAPLAAACGWPKDPASAGRPRAVCSPNRFEPAAALSFAWRNSPATTSGLPRVD